MVLPIEGESKDVKRSENLLFLLGEAVEGQGSWVGELSVFFFLQNG